MAAVFLVFVSFSKRPSFPIFQRVVNTQSFSTEITTCMHELQAIPSILSWQRARQFLRGHFSSFQSKRSRSKTREPMTVRSPGAKLDQVYSIYPKVGKESCAFLL